VIPVVVGSSPIVHPNSRHLPTVHGSIRGTGIDCW
jgi:hypothetical protein